MKCKQMFSLRNVAIFLITGSSIIMTVIYLPFEPYFQNSYNYVVSLNLTFPGALLPWSLFGTGPSNDTWVTQENMIINPKQKQFFFLEWQSKKDHDVNISDKLIQISDTIKVTGISCQALITGLGINKAKVSTKANKTDVPLSDNMYANLTADCENFQTSRGYIMSSLTKEEEDFPLAFSILVYRDLEMVERLLRAIYRPQNYYCIHVDKKTSAVFYKSALAIAKCFPNVFVACRRIKVYWGGFSVLEPEILCMQELWKNRKWKYFINLTGQEFPLKTNLELVKILTAYRGASDVHTLLKCADRPRWRKTVPPFGLRPAEGSVHIAANRFFVDYILHNATAKALLDWTRRTTVPDETFFATLNSNPTLGIKGTYTGTQDGCDKRPTLTRYKMWKRHPCAGQRYRRICILTVGDLPRLIKAKEMFANKFFLYQDRTVIGCLEEKIFNDTRDEYLGLSTFNASFYSTLDYVIHQVT